MPKTAEGASATAISLALEKAVREKGQSRPLLMPSFLLKNFSTAFFAETEFLRSVVVF
ncbi:hypothetical protein [Pseudomonas sp. O230]|uniref:hypothetical protein n=1 Tax=Pseudomonas sp. O230 TaxID=3159450 RepID=UPI00387B4C03